VAVIEEMSRKKARILEDIQKRKYKVPKRKIRPRKILVSYKQYNP